jgi:hypothetical protein
MGSTLAGREYDVNARGRAHNCLGLSVACERDDAGKALLLRVAGDGQATMEETAAAMRSREMSARRYGDFIVSMATGAVLATVKTCESAAGFVIVR